MKISEKIHYNYPWKVHEISKDFYLLDVWEYPILADESKNENFYFFQEMMEKNNILHISGHFADFLFKLRKFLGKIFGFDKDINTLPIPGCKETSVKERLSISEQKNNIIEQKPKENNKSFVKFQKVYSYDNESLQELSNNTVHALLHTGWIHKYENYYTAQLAIYVKTRGLIGKIYMIIIMPFRWFIVYPAMMRTVKTNWRKYCKDYISV